MTIEGWIVLVGSVGSVTAFLLWCIWKFFTTSESSKHLHGFEFEPDPVKAKRKEGL